MHRNDERESDLIELGTASVDTKGPPVPINLDVQGSLGDGAISDE